MTQERENYLFGSLEKAYVEERGRFEAEKSSERIKELVEIINAIIDKENQEKDNNIKIKRGSYEEENTLTVTAAGVEYGDLIEIGETANTRSSGWLPCGQREVNKSTVNFQVRFQKIEFVRLQNDPPKSRVGPIIIDGQLIDDDGVKADFPIVRFLPDKETGEMKLYYNFGSEIPFGSADYQEIEHIVQIAKNSA